MAFYIIFKLCLLFVGFSLNQSINFTASVHPRWLLSNFSVSMSVYFFSRTQFTPFSRIALPIWFTNSLWMSVFVKCARYNSYSHRTCVIKLVRFDEVQVCTVEYETCSHCSINSNYLHSNHVKTEKKSILWKKNSNWPIKITLSILINVNYQHAICYLLSHITCQNRLM